jgi:hypothetical protein
MFKTFYNEFHDELAVIANDAERPFELPQPQWCYVGERAVTPLISKRLTITPVYIVKCSIDPYDPDRIVGAGRRRGHAGTAQTPWLQALHYKLRALGGLFSFGKSA